MGPRGKLEERGKLDRLAEHGAGQASREGTLPRAASPYVGPCSHLLGDHAADLRQEVLAEQFVELALSHRGPLPEALGDLSPLLLSLAQEPPGALPWSLGP